MVAMPQTLPEGEAFLERWRGIADFVGIGGFSTRLESVALQGGADTRQGEQFRCVRAAVSRTNIWADGKAVLCCEDWNEEYVVGDLNTEDLSAIWHGSQRMAAVRAKHLAGLGHDIDLCSRCNNWRGPGAGVRLWNSPESGSPQ